MEQIPRLDILIYAHDGRGLGHVSRSIGVGMALRRLYPELKVLLVTGCRLARELIGPAPLDWLKLPSYATRVDGGRSVGIPGQSGYADAELGALRARELRHLVQLYRPRVVLVDHTPQGKHRELVEAIGAGRAYGTQWVLGVRGVVGEVPQATSDLGAELFAASYRALLWYGDSRVLGPSHRELLHRHYGIEPVECGYVVRLAELACWSKKIEADAGHLAGTVAVPWLGEKSRGFLEALSAALGKIPESYGGWRLFLETGPEHESSPGDLFRDLRNCRVEPPGDGYVEALLNSKTAVLFGGYNSIMDILHVRLPALVVYREMADEEQRIHLERIVAVTGDQVTMLPEGRIGAEELARAIRRNLGRDKAAAYGIATDGAAGAAIFLRDLLP